MGTTEGAASSNGSGGVATKSPSVSAAGVSNFRGRRVKRFRLVDELGRGAMGRVFLAEDTVLKRHVALKLLPSKHRDGRPNHRTERLIREARSAATLEHPNAVTVYEIDESAGVHYIAMELVEGGNLEKLVQMSGPMEVERACQLVAEAAEVLGHAHNRGIVHRDVKPANLLLTRNGRCKVTDFGLALFDESQEADIQKRCVGTPHFIAPEVAQGMGATALSDVYGLGCTLYFLLVGKPPYSGKSPAELLEAHIRLPMPDVREARPDVPERLAQVIAHCCAKDPHERFEDAEKLGKVLRTFTISTNAPAELGSGSTSVQMAAMPAAAPPYVPNRAGALDHGMRVKFSVPAPVIWGGAGTLAAVVLIVVGVWIAKWKSETPPAAAHTGDSALFASSSAKPASATIETTNVVKNGSMDLSDPHGSSAGWFIHDRFKDVITIEEENGNKFLRISNTDATRTIFADQKISVDPDWKALNISALMRATNFKAGKQPFQDARVAFKFEDAKGNRVGNWPSVPAVKEDTPWVDRVVTVDVPAGAKTLYLQLAMFNATGTVDFDDVKVVPQKGQ